ncbi:MAG: hypothetical protein NW214_15385 [Pseudanabaenaceae cyanobacterium bins.39]|nr:hypothetical protein [Pseudanabaenaceae cyanobacterium bins.39]
MTSIRKLVKVFNIFHQLIQQMAKSCLKYGLNIWRSLFARKSSPHARTFSKSKGRSTAKNTQKNTVFGFTLIELLVASLIASLMVVVMMGFLLTVLDTDRKETAKSNAQEELQAAIAYMSDDLQEAMYIYGASGIASINNQLPHTQSGTGNECNPSGTNTCTPILVFWKRTAFAPESTRTYSKSGATPSSDKVGCMPYKTTTNCNSTNTNLNPYAKPFGRETYGYSLVAYYLKNDATNAGVFSGTARILRWELSDGYVWYCSTGGTIADTTNCPTDKATLRLPTNSSPLITSPVTLVDSNNYFISPAKGFNRPDFSSATAILSWKKFDNYDFAANPFVTLVDFMDDTDYSTSQGGNNDAGTASGATAAIRIPVGKNVTIAGTLTNPDCDDPSIGVGNVSPITTTNPNGIATERVPADFTNATSNPAGLSSFYMCVAPSRVTARIFLRGNAIARLATPPIPKDQRLPTDARLPFFPTADVRSFGRSTVGLS